MGASQLSTKCEFQLKMDHLVFEYTSNKTTWAAEADLGEGPGRGGVPLIFGRKRRNDRREKSQQDK